MHQMTSTSVQYSELKEDGFYIETGVVTGEC